MKNLLIASLLSAVMSSAVAEAPQYTVQVLDPSGQVVASTKVGLYGGLPQPVSLMGRTLESDMPHQVGTPIYLRGIVIAAGLLPPGCYHDQNLNPTCDAAPKVDKHATR